MNHLIDPTKRADLLSTITVRLPNGAAFNEWCGLGIHQGHLVSITASATPSFRRAGEQPDADFRPRLWVNYLPRQNHPGATEGYVDAIRTQGRPSELGAEWAEYLPTDGPKAHHLSYTEVERMLAQ